VLRLRVTLADVVPTVWRRLLVRGDIGLAQLHHVLQVAMGWQDRHLHNFRFGSQTFGTQIDDYPSDELDEAQMTLQRAIGDGRRFRYVYDFGDDWVHEVVVEDVVTTRNALRSAVCVDGQSACPPEDCGGPPGYAELLEVLGDPGHEDHDRLARWTGVPIDPATFDLATANVALQRLH